MAASTIALSLILQRDRTSAICRPLSGVIVEADDPMLAYYFPPNHFNCRTTVRQLRNGPATKDYEKPDIPEAFQNNVGETGEIFTDKNAYIENTPQELLSDLDYIERDGLMVSTKAEKWSSSARERQKQVAEYRTRLDAAKALRDYLNAVMVKILPEIKPGQLCLPLPRSPRARKGHRPVDRWKILGSRKL